MAQTTLIVVDSSVEFCASLAKMLEAGGRARVVGYAGDAYEARE